MIQIAQQLTWFCAVFRVPKDGKFIRFEFVLNSSKRSREFNVKLLKLKNVGPTDTCWHSLFTNGVLAYEFPIRSRCCEVGVELSFKAMLQLAGIIGPVQYRGGVVLKGYSKILFPQSTTSLSPVSSPESTQWHLVYQTDGDFIDLSSIAEYNDRVLCTLESLESLMHSRTFLGCYKEVNIHLGTETASYHQIDTSNAKDLKRRPELSSFTFGLSLPKFGGPSASMTYTLPKGLSISRKEDSYEQVLSLGSYMPMILYDTSDRRAWMVPMLGVILHMIHIWAFLQKTQFPSLVIPQLPYIKAQWDIGRAAQEVIYENSDLKLYVSKDKHEPYMLKDLVKKYWLELKMITAAKKDHHVSGNEDLIGWELLEIVNRDPFSSLKKPSTKKFKGNWFGLAGDPSMIVLFCNGLGDVVKPSPNVQEVCSRWNQCLQRMTTWRPPTIALYNAPNGFSATLYFGNAEVTRIHALTVSIIQLGHASAFSS